MENIKNSIRAIGITNYLNLGRNLKKAVFVENEITEIPNTLPALTSPSTILLSICDIVSSFASTTMLIYLKTTSYLNKIQSYQKTR